MEEFIVQLSLGNILTIIAGVGSIVIMAWRLGKKFGEINSTILNSNSILDTKIERNQECLVRVESKIDDHVAETKPLIERFHKIEATVEAHTKAIDILMQDEVE